MLMLICAKLITMNPVEEKKKNKLFSSVEKQKICELVKKASS